jgi:hypothetical protein
MVTTKASGGKFMKTTRLNRRQFLQRSVAITGTLMLNPGALSQGRAAIAKHTTVDQMALGQTGIRFSRLGMGTGSNSGQVQRDLGAKGSTAW